MLIFIEVFAFIFLSNTHFNTEHNDLVPALELTNYFQPYRFVTVIIHCNWQDLSGTNSVVNKSCQNCS